MFILIACNENTGEGILKIANKHYYFPFPYEDCTEITDLQSDIISIRNNFSFLTPPKHFDSKKAIAEYLAELYVNSHILEKQQGDFRSSYEDATIEDIEIDLDYVIELTAQWNFDLAENILDKISYCPLLDKTSIKGRIDLIKRYEDTRKAFFQFKQYVDETPDVDNPLYVLEEDEESVYKIYNQLRERVRKAEKSIQVLTTLTTSNQNKRSDWLVDALEKYYKEINRKVVSCPHIEYSRSFVFTDKALRNRFYKKPDNYIISHIKKLSKNENFKLYHLNEDTTSYNYMLIDNNFLIIEYHKSDDNNEPLPHAYRLFFPELNNQEYINIHIAQMNWYLEDKCEILTVKGLLNKVENLSKKIKIIPLHPVGI